MSSSRVPPPTSPAPAEAAGSTNTLAVVGLVLALLALALDYLVVIGTLPDLGTLGFLSPLAASIAAVVIGHIALARANRHPAGQARRGLAIAGLVLGYLALAGFVGFVVLLLRAFFTLG